MNEKRLPHLAALPRAPRAPRAETATMAAHASRAERATHSRPHAVHAVRVSRRKTLGPTEHTMEASKAPRTTTEHALLERLTRAENKRRGLK